MEAHRRATIILHIMNWNLLRVACILRILRLSPPPPPSWVASFGLWPRTTCDDNCSNSSLATHSFTNTIFSPL
ncbi:hypothetical protein M404DRAFT_532594 [Pisolithus tinctorius Marx 270]|uniref:Uncharacterized protein n=1 Tax=Pisolithus tinctorius Marx 270 TaxID=870435 RepID=A0A0C3K642_PISTI|nr:hypothetical protein M404DRAFT_532594 [Pisolithus tinctorius Marx 270]